MSYVAIKGGDAAVEKAKGLMELLRARGAVENEPPLQIDQIQHQLHFLHSSVMNEGAYYDPQLASLAVKQAMGDSLEAAFLLRAFRCSRPRLATTPILDTRSMRLIRRISSAFKEIPGGQRLGPTNDYRQRLFNMSLLDESPEAFRKVVEPWLGPLREADPPEDLPKVVEMLRQRGLLDDPPICDAKPFDVTREPIVFPLPRSGVLSSLARGQRGSMLALAYSSMRGYGDIHPTIAELRVGYVPVMLPHPVDGEPMEVGEVLMTECEVVSLFDDREHDGDALREGRGETAQLGQDGMPRFKLGYGACFGHDEVKAICMAVLDRTIHGVGETAKHPAEDAEFVLMHIDGVDSLGFSIHWKLPHYVTFQSDLDRLREAQNQRSAFERTTEPVS